MKIDNQKVEQFIWKIANSSARTFQANVYQFFQYVDANISKENLKYKQYENDREEKWGRWPSQVADWTMPNDTEEARSLSYCLYREISEHGLEAVGTLYLIGDDETVNRFNYDFRDHFYQAIQEMNLLEQGDIDQRKEIANDSSVVFVVYGRNEKIRIAMFNFLRSIRLTPLEWSHLLLQTKEASPYVGTILEAAFTQAQAVIVMLTPDDDVKLKDEFISASDDEYERKPFGQSRPNVLFEGGMAMGRHPERTVFVQIGTVKPFSDIVGRHLVKMDNSMGKRQDLANRLKAAGCSVNLEGTDWHKTGDFSIEAVRG